MSAIFSPCRTWRYTLERHWADIQIAREVSLVPRTVAFVGLNPSTADETVDDPTVRRCVGYARRWGFGRMVMLNIFAFRSTDPRNLFMLSMREAIGPGNDQHIAREADEAALVVCCWGAHGGLGGRGAHVRANLDGLEKPLHILGLTKAGYPRHPLYLRADLEPVVWT